VVEYIENIKVNFLRTVPKKNSRPNKVVPSLTVVSKTKMDETSIPFHKYTMPKQPQGYIKYPRYDFF